MNNLAQLLERVEKDDEARQWYERAAELGDTVAMNNLGKLLARIGDYAEAEKWLKRAAELGDGSELGEVLQAGGRLVGYTTEATLPRGSNN